MTTPEVELRSTWRSLAGSGHDHLLDAVLARHREAHRRYHTLTHVMWVLRHISTLSAAGEPTTDLAAVQLAALWHDAVYNAAASDNEARSAQLAKAAADDLGWTAARQELVEQLVLATAGHQPTDADEAMLVDADLAILGAPPHEYAAYVAGVRSEYAHVSDDAWRTGRSAVLGGFLGQSQLFTTATMRAQREMRARANITAELAAMAD
jgi:predicted metal-dependent HD superfamily phosphohydrolase